MTRTLSTLLLGSIAFSQAALAGTDKSPVEKIAATESESSAFDKIWSIFTLYKNKDNPVIQEFKLRGRYHGQQHWVDSDQGNENGWEDRRSRFGFDAKLFKQFEVRLDAQSTDGFDPFYGGLVDAYIKWLPSESFNLTLGRQKPQIAAFDFLPSTNAQQTFERSQIFNQLGVDRTVGAVANGKIGSWTYQGGVYSNQIDKEFGQFDGGISFGAGVAYNLAELTHLKAAEVRFDWLHSDLDDNDTILNRYENIFTTTLTLKDNRWALGTELFYATGNQPDVFGFFIQPSYDIIDKKLQVVTRYSFSTGDGADSLTAQGRYERRAPDLTGGGKGEQYQAVYLGLQYFIYGDKLKLQAGAEYANLDGGGNGGDYEGITYLAGVRFSF